MIKPKTFAAALLMLLGLLIGFAAGYRLHSEHKAVAPTYHAAKSGPIICIDPGHPSETNSARIRQNGTTELDMNWQVARRLESVLRGRYHIRVVRTKEDRDEFVRNHTRAYIANGCGADLALHLHCDTGPGAGFTVYYPNRCGRCEGHNGPSPDIISESHRAAQALHDGMTQVLGASLHDRGIFGEDRTHIGSIKGALTTSVFSTVPAVTVEMVFLSNAHDAAFIKSRAGQDKLTQALAQGVVDYLRSRGYKIRANSI